MFEIPNAKRVRRDELYGSSSEGEDHSEHGVEDAEERARLNERLSSLLGLDLSAPELAPEQRPDAADAHGHDGPEGDEGTHEEEEFEFRLFSTLAKTATPGKVILSASDDEDAANGEGAFVQPSRPESYYLAGEATPEQLERYHSAAVTAEDIAAGASRRAWGLERPWRVVKISLSSRKSPSGLGLVAGATKASDDAEDGAKRKRPGKKRRIATRIKARAEKERREAAKAKKEAEEKQKISKEEHLAEKKKRLNREKKLKRRAKEKEKKLVGGGTQPASEAPSSPSSE